MGRLLHSHPTTLLDDLLPGLAELITPFLLPFQR